MGLPIILAVHDDRGALGEVQEALLERYAKSYRVVCVPSAEQARAFVTEAVASDENLAHAIAIAIDVAREARAEATAKRAERDAERMRRADLETELAAVIEAAREESWALLGALTAAQRDELGVATRQAVAALGRRGLLEPAVLRDLRDADAGQLRYGVGL